MQGGGDGSFDEGDAVWFYGKGPSGWYSKQLTDPRGRPILDQSGELIREWTHYVHPFDSTNYYFLDIGTAESQAYVQENYTDSPATAVLSEVNGRFFVDLDEYLWGREGGHSGHTWVSALIPGAGPGRTLFQDSHLPGLGSGILRYQIRAAIQSNPAARLHYRDESRTLHSVNYGPVGNVATNPIARSGITEFEQTVTANQAITLTADLEEQIGGPQAAIDWVRIFYPKVLRAGEAPTPIQYPSGRSRDLYIRPAGVQFSPDCS